MSTIEQDIYWKRVSNIKNPLPALDSHPCEYWFDDYWNRVDRYEATRLFAVFLLPKLLHEITGINPEKS